MLDTNNVALQTLPQSRVHQQQGRVSILMGSVRSRNTTCTTGSKNKLHTDHFMFLITPASHCQFSHTHTHMHPCPHTDIQGIFDFKDDHIKSIYLNAKSSQSTRKTRFINEKSFRKLLSS